MVGHKILVLGVGVRVPLPQRRQFLFFIILDFLGLIKDLMTVVMIDIRSQMDS